MKNLICGITAKELKVLANRVAKATDCEVTDNEGLLRSYNLSDKETGEFFINIPEAGKITGAKNLSIEFNKFGYNVIETAEYFCSTHCFHIV